MIPKNMPVVDIGCDHALLDIYLTQKKTNICTASDVKISVLTHAYLNIKKYHLEDKIAIVKSNGLEAIQLLPNSIVVIAGMGTSTILSILENKKIDSCSYLIIQTNNEWDRLRKEISLKGFSLDQEKVVIEHGKYYVIMRWKKGMVRYTAKQCFLGPLLMKEKNDLYFSYLFHRYQSIYQKIPFHKWKKRHYIAKRIKWIQKELKK